MRLFEHAPLFIVTFHEITIKYESDLKAQLALIDFYEP